MGFQQRFLYLLLWAAAARAQNTQFCSWESPRAGVVRNSFFIEGGTLVANGVWRNGQWVGCQYEAPTQGSLYRLDFNNSFDVTTINMNNVLIPLQETLDGSAPVFVSGTMFADNYEWYTFGGREFPAVSNTTSNDTVTWNGLYQPNAEATNAPKGIRTDFPISGNFTQYITNGAGTSVPSESKGFYFSGYMTANGTAISDIPTGDDRPTTLVTTMLELDSSNYESPIWSQTDLPANVTPRADASMVWVPVGSHGALVVIGGVTISVDLFGNPYLNSSQMANVTSQSPSFMTEIPVYDIGSQTWYVQQTSGSPPNITAKACAVRVTAGDSSSHEVYLYGGFDGTWQSPPYDSVWVLSLPAFRWVQATTGNINHGRASHVCATPYPNKLITVGGSGLFGGGNPLATQNFIDVFDLNSLTWTGVYDAANDTAYTVPSIVASAISGNNAVASNMDPNLAALFQQPYQGTITNFYPYVQPSATPGSGNTTSSGKPSWLVPVVVVIVIVVVAVAVGAALWFFCRPSRRKARSEAMSLSNMSRGRVARWLSHGQTPDPIPPKSIVSEETTEVGDPFSQHVGGPFEADSYFAPKASEMYVDSTGRSRNASQPGSTVTSPGSGIASELATSPHRHELDSNPSIRNHPMYPLNVFGRHRSQRSNQTTLASQPQSNGSASGSGLRTASQRFELPGNKSSENVGPSALTESNVNQDSVSQSNTVSNDGMSNASPPSPDLRSATVPLSSPRPYIGQSTVATISRATGQPTGNGLPEGSHVIDHATHIRNNSSLSTAVSPLSTDINANTNHNRHSAYLTNLPDIAHGHPNGLTSSPIEEDEESVSTHIASTVNVSPVARQNLQVRETTSTSPRRTNVRSAYDENTARRERNMSEDGLPLPMELGKEGWGGGTI